MTHGFDQDYWQAHWRTREGGVDEATDARPVVRDLPPNPYLVAEIGALPAGTALDAGCGEGAEAIWLAAHGWDVTGADISVEALTRAEQRAERHGSPAVRWLEADLSVWSPDTLFDLVTTHYAHAAIPQLEFYRRLADWVAPGGTLFIVGHRHDGAGDHGHSHDHEHGHAGDDGTGGGRTGVHVHGDGGGHRDGHRGGVGVGVGDGRGRGDRDRHGRGHGDGPENAPGDGRPGAHEGVHGDGDPGGLEGGRGNGRAGGHGHAGGAHGDGPENAPGNGHPDGHDGGHGHGHVGGDGGEPGHAGGAHGDGPEGAPGDRHPVAHDGGPEGAPGDGHPDGHEGGHGHGHVGGHGGEPGHEHAHGQDAGGREQVRGAAQEPPPVEATVTAAGVAASLNPQQWRIETADERTRSVPDGAGGTRELRDVVVRATRLH